MTIRYLPYPESRGQIRNGARATYGGCASDSVIVSPNDVGLDRGGDGVQLYTFLLNEHGSPIADRTIEWSSSDPSRVQVYEDGSVAARFPSSFPEIWCGNAEPTPNVVYFDVTVTARSRSATTAVRVRVRDRFGCTH